MPTDFSSVVIETLEAPLPVGTVLSSVVIETLEAPLPAGTVLYSMVIENLENPPLPVAVVSNIVGTVGSPATFDGSGSTASAYAWTMTSVPGGSSVSVPTPFPDGGATTPIDMTNNVALYHFDTGAVATDSSGAGNNLTTDTTTVTGSPKVGTASASFSGSSQYMHTASGTASLQITGDMTFAVWIKPTSIATNDMIMMYNNLSGGESLATNILYGLWFLNTSGGLRYFHEYGSGTNQILDFGNYITTGSWQHVAFVRDATAKTVILYVNGVAKETQSYTTNPEGGTTNALIIGTRENLSDRFYDGLMDEMAIWSRALSSTEIADIYALQDANGSTLTFTPDVAGTYSVQLEVSAEVYGSVVTDTATADAVIAAVPAPGSGGNSINFAGSLASSDRVLLSSSIIKRIVRRKK